MGFQRVITNLQVHIVTTTSTFHGPSICNHDLEVVYYMDITMCLLDDSVINKVMGATGVNEDNDFMMLEVAN